MREASIHHEQRLEASQTQGTRRRQYRRHSQMRGGQRDVALQALGGPDNAARPHLRPRDRATQGERLATQGMPRVNDRDDALRARELAQRGS
jgi:hypothetical protein